MTVEVVYDSLLHQDVDAIVNPANRYMLHGGGLARIIAGVAGPDVVKESQQIVEDNPIDTGEAIITGPGNLSCQAIIHTVGPVWEGSNDAPYWRRNTPGTPDEQLASAHTNAIRLAAEHDLTSVAFPAVSCDVFRFPVKRAAPIAVVAVREALIEYPTVKRVVFCLLDDEHFAAFHNANGLKIKLWHDDIRRPPEGWRWARTNDAAKALLEHYAVEEISLDHDLGLHQADPDAPAAELGRGDSSEGSGYDLVKWMCETGNLPEKITVHSWNPDGAKRMAAALQDMGCQVTVSPYTMRTDP